MPPPELDRPEASSDLDESLAADVRSRVRGDGLEVSVVGAQVQEHPVLLRQAPLDLRGLPESQVDVHGAVNRQIVIHPELALDAQEAGDHARGVTLAVD